MIRARYRRIVFFFARILSSFVFWDLLLPRLGFRGWSQRTRSERFQRSAAAFRALAIQMGGVLIKVGQFLSTRVDVLPVEITGELSGLQDEVPAESVADIIQVIEAEFGEPLEAKFIEFETQPLAAASLGQVHRARLHPGAGDTPQREVVVKIQRPNIELLIATDLAALTTVGRWLARYRPISRRANVPALLKEFTRILYEEIDYLAEGRNAETFADNFQSFEWVHVPKVYWSHTTKRVLTLENVMAIKISDYEAISAAGINRTEVAECLLDTYLKQIFEDSFFHADPHPGNLFVSPLTLPSPSSAGNNDSLADWRLTFIDFGMVGRIAPNVRLGLREMLIGVGTQDAARVVRSYQTLGVLLPHADLDLLEKAEARVFDRFWGKSMSELRDIDMEEVRQFAQEFRQLIASLPFQVPQDLIFLGRAVGILSGICTGLDPEFNFFEQLTPYARKMIDQEGRSTRDTLRDELGSLARSFLSVPKKMDTMLSKMERGDIEVQTPQIQKQVERIERSLKGVSTSIVFTGLLLGGIQLHLAGEVGFSQVLFFGSGLSLLWLLLKRR